MKKVLRIVKKGEDDSNIKYWLSLSFFQRMQELENIRKEINSVKYHAEQGFQRVYKIIKRK